MVNQRHGFATGGGDIETAVLEKVELNWHLEKNCTNTAWQYGSKKGVHSAGSLFEMSRAGWILNLAMMTSIQRSRPEICRLVQIAAKQSACWAGFLTRQCIHIYIVQRCTKCAVSRWLNNYADFSTPCNQEVCTEMADVVVPNGDHMPSTPKKSGLSLTEYTTNPSPKSESSSPKEKIQFAIPDAFILPNGFPDVIVKKRTIHEHPLIVS
jgi:hypothetical protein